MQTYILGARLGSSDFKSLQLQVHRCDVTYQRSLDYSVTHMVRFTITYTRHGCLVLPSLLSFLLRYYSGASHLHICMVGAH